MKSLAAIVAEIDRLEARLTELRAEAMERLGGAQGPPVRRPVAGSPPVDGRRRPRTEAEKQRLRDNAARRREAEAEEIRRIQAERAREAEIHQPVPRTPPDTRTIIEKRADLRNEPYSERIRGEGEEPESEEPVRGETTRG